jgi:hypothetical protein
LTGVFGLGIVVGTLLTGTALAGGQKPAANAVDAKAMETLLAKDQIREQLYNYGRGLDRMDKALALSAYHSDSTVGGVFTGTGEQWIDSARRTLERESASSHQMTNMLIHVDGDNLDKASSETYFIVSQHAAADSGAANMPHTSLVRGRYVDTWSKRAGRWAIAHREIIIDFSTNDMTATATRSLGKRDKTDPSYKFFN